MMIWGKTSPELSDTYREVVCTGAALESTNELIRIYPVPLRFLNDDQLFAKGHVIEALIAPADRDRRPESRSSILDQSR